MDKNKQINLSPEDIASLQRMVYGEAAGSDYGTMKMIAQSAINRLRSGRKEKGFRGGLQKILKEAYYAVSNPNQPYKQALSGQFNDDSSKKAWAQANQAIMDVVNNQDYGQVQFYFTPDEVVKQKKYGFDFNAVVPTGKVGNYLTFAYPETVSHYKK